MIVWFLATVVALPNLILFHVSQDLVSFRAALAATCHAWPLPLITLSKLEGEKWSVDGHLVDFVLQKKCIFEACLFPYLTSKASVWPFSDFFSTFFSWLTIPTSKESLVASLTWKLLAVKGLGKIILWQRYLCNIASLSPSLHFVTAIWPRLTTRFAVHINFDLID